MREPQDHEDYQRHVLLDQIDALTAKVEENIRLLHAAAALLHTWKTCYLISPLHNQDLNKWLKALRGMEK